MTPPPSVLTLGETMTMVTPDPPAPLETATVFRLDIGGAEANVASLLARAGGHAAWAGAVGDDALGRRLLATLAARGVDTRWVRVDPDAPTGVYFKDPRQDGTRVLYHRRGSAASRLGPGFAATLPLRHSSVVHLSGVTAALSDSCRGLLDEVVTVRADAGLPVSFDVNFRPGLWSAAAAAEVLLELASRCDLVFVGLDEAAVLWGTVTAGDVADLLGRRASRAATVVVKDGARGAQALRSGGEAVFVPALQVEVVEPVGAGDAFAAGYLAATIAGRRTDEALARGHRMAAAVIRSTTDYPADGEQEHENE